jgi:phage-related tail fiber protein
MKYNIKMIFLLFSIFVTVAIQSFAASKMTIFYLNEKFLPVVKLEKLAPLTDGMRAILAMYALQNGAGCSGGNANLICSLTKSLNLSDQCSKEHINLIRSWFKNGIPKMSGYAGHVYKNINKPGILESICYHHSDSGSYQSIWHIIRVIQKANYIIVDAQGSWLAREKTGTFRYITEYKINTNSVAVVSHKAR